MFVLYGLFTPTNVYIRQIILYIKKKTYLTISWFTWKNVFAKRGHFKVHPSVNLSVRRGRLTASTPVASLVLPFYLTFP